MQRPRREVPKRAMTHKAAARKHLSSRRLPRPVYCSLTFRPGYRWAL